MGFVDHIIRSRHNRNGILSDDAVYEFADDGRISQFGLRGLRLLADADAHFRDPQGHAVQADCSYTDGKFFS